MIGQVERPQGSAVPLDALGLDLRPACRLAAGRSRRRGASRRQPSTSTRQVRQAPAGSSRGSWHRVGIASAARSAACRIGFARAKRDGASPELERRLVRSPSRCHSERPSVLSVRLRRPRRGRIPRGSARMRRRQRQGRRLARARRSSPRSSATPRRPRGPGGRVPLARWSAGGIELRVQGLVLGRTRRYRCRCDTARTARSSRPRRSAGTARSTPSAGRPSSLRTTTPAPTEHRADLGQRSVKSSGRSRSDAGRKPELAPPGAENAFRVAFTHAAGGLHAARRAWHRGAARRCPGRATCTADRSTASCPGLSGPSAREPVAPALHDRRHARDGLNVVDQRRLAPEPDLDRGRGGLSRGMPRLPSSASSSAVSSPQMYAPWPACRWKRSPVGVPRPSQRCDGLQRPPARAGPRTRRASTGRRRRHRPLAPRSPALRAQGPVGAA